MWRRKWNRCGSAFALRGNNSVLGAILWAGLHISFIYFMHVVRFGLPLRIPYMFALQVCSVEALHWCGVLAHSCSSIGALMVVWCGWHCVTCELATIRLMMGTGFGTCHVYIIMRTF